ncbi:MAG TPA: hypothetical protein VJ862_01305 [Rhodanobacteraceae bacterium]|nr:hypothetical protein [Rhodanobacteraceae bacterium]
MKKHVFLLAFAWLTCMAMPALAGESHAAPANRAGGDINVQQHNAPEVTSGTTLWKLLGQLLWNTTADDTQPAAVYVGGGLTSGYAISARTCELLGREAQLFKRVLDTGRYTSADLSEASVIQHAEKAGINRYTPAFWTITTSRMVATNPANADMSAGKMGQKMYGMCMHKFLGEEIAYQ